MSQIVKVEVHEFSHNVRNLGLLTNEKTIGAVGYSKGEETEVENARGIGEDKYSTFISDMANSLRQSLIKGLEAGQDSQSLPLALKDTAFGLTISLLKGEDLSIPIKTITCEIDQSDLVVAS